MDTATKYAELIATAQKVDTTTGMNGYPQHLKVAYTADTMAELRDLKEAAEAAGHQVSILGLHRRDGWALWERQANNGLEDDRWMGSGGDWMITMDKDSDAEALAFAAVCGEEYKVEDAYDLFKKSEQVGSLADELPDPDELEDGEQVVCFIDTGNWSIDYTVKTGQNGYSYDTHHYRSALLIEERDE